MEFLTPKQAARALGASEASLKRWCDSGIFPTRRTAGGHRRIPLFAVLRYLRESGKTIADPTVLGLPATTGRGRTVRNRARRQILEALRNGDEACLQQILFDLYLARLTPCEISDELLAPAFHDIGHQWYCRELDVFHERRACEICLRTVHRLHATLEPIDPAGPLAIGAAAETDPYTIPTTLAEWVLRAAGWRAESLGSNLPLASLAQAAEELSPRFVWLSVSWVADGDRFRTDLAALAERLRELNTPLIIGGAWTRQNMPPRGIANGTCFADLLRFAESFTLATHGNAGVTAAKQQSGS